MYIKKSSRPRHNPCGMLYLISSKLDTRLLLSLVRLGTLGEEFKNYSQKGSKVDSI